MTSARLELVLSEDAWRLLHRQSSFKVSMALSSRFLVELGREIPSRLICSSLLPKSLAEAFRVFRRGKASFYYTPRNYDPIAHLLYADDTLIFVKLEKYPQSEGSLHFKMNTVMRLVRDSKSQFLLDKDANQVRINSLKRDTGFAHKFLPMTYLGLPIFHGTAKIYYFESSLSKVQHLTDGWSFRFLSKGEDDPSQSYTGIHSYIHPISIFHPESNVS